MKSTFKAAVFGLAASLAMAGAVAADIGTDDRVKVVLKPDERHLVLLEMRSFLNVVQTITDALTREDMKAVAEAARSMGSGAANQIPPQTVAKLPDTFQMLAGTVHTSFDVMALDADSLGDPMHTQRQMGRLLQTCNACHGIYQVAVETEPFPRLKR
jgi:cytochrome c553